MIKILQLQEITDQQARGIAPLLTRFVIGDEVYLESMRALAASPVTELFIARNDDWEIVGAMTLNLRQKQNGRRTTIIKDLVVLEKWRGNGIATRLINEAIKVSRMGKAQEVSVNCEPNAEAASLFEKAGFTLRNGNNWRYVIEVAA